jgi:hypothetical protein
MNLKTASQIQHPRVAHTGWLGAHRSSGPAQQTNTARPCGRPAGKFRFPFCYRSCLCRNPCGISSDEGICCPLSPGFPTSSDVSGCLLIDGAPLARVNKGR